MFYERREDYSLRTNKRTPMIHYRLFAAGLLFTFTVIAGTVNGQPDWENLSARDRLRIGEQEKEEAKNDAQFQQLMHEGHQLFEGRHYLKAIHKYEAAQEERPYNVYPKVIITDIELSMKDTLAVLRDAERAEEADKEKEDQKVKREKPDEVKEKPEPKITETKQETIDRLSEWERQERRNRERARERQEEQQAAPEPTLTSGEVPQMSTEDYQEELGQTYPQGVTENVEKQGNKTITTRVVVKDKRGNAYRKVAHDWGGVFYFKNGEAVTERVWNQETTM